MKKRQGNISILVLFVLIAASLMGVLTMNFVNQMIYDANTVLSYYKSYYISNAGLELLLTETKHRGIGFETRLGTGNEIFTQNFTCENCDLSSSISGATSLLSKEFWRGGGCLSPFTLAQGQSIIIPLFRDNFSGSFAQGFASGTSYQNLSSTIDSLKFQLMSGNLTIPQLVIGFLIMNNDEIYTNGIFFRTGIINEQTMTNFMAEWKANADTIEPISGSDYTLSYLYDKDASAYPFKNYLMLANTSSGADPISFCLESLLPLPTDNFYIKSNGFYHGQTLGLELMYKQPIPGFLMNGYTQFDGIGTTPVVANDQSSQ